MKARRWGSLGAIIVAGYHKYHRNAQLEEIGRVYWLVVKENQNLFPFANQTSVTIHPGGSFISSPNSLVVACSLPSLENLPVISRAVFPTV